MTDDRKKQLATAVLKLRLRLDPPCTQPKLAEYLGYEDKQTIYRYEKHGPPAEALPRLAIFARSAGEDGAAAEFLDAFLDEFPGLRALIRSDPSFSTPSTEAPSGDKHLRKAEKPPFSGIKDKRSRELHELLDQILALHMESVAGPVEATMRALLDLAARKEK